MMDRGRSTLIDPATLKGPVGRSGSYGPVQGGLSRQNSLSMKPLLTFDDEQLDTRPPPGPRMASTRSVFGTDTLWERETAKLKEIEAQEKIEAERRRLAEEEEERQREAKGKKKKKKKKKGAEPSGDEYPAVTAPLEPRVSVEPPILPDIERAPRRAPPKPTESDSESDSDGEVPSPSNVKQVTPGWNDDSSDEEAGRPRRTTGVGLRYPKQQQMPQPSHLVDDSDEDAPLAATIHKAAARMAKSGSQPLSPDSDDEDQPLSRILHKAKSDTASFHHLSPRRQPAGPKLDSSDDDEPLGLRASRIPSGAQGDEDDMPLAFHPEQQRRTQYQMLAQQQQQMMAQMQSNMFMSPGFMNPGYFPMMNPMAMMQPPIPVPSPPPVQDEAKFGLVDRWRRDVVVDE